MIFIQSPYIIKNCLPTELQIWLFRNEYRQDDLDDSTLNEESIKSL